MRILVANNHLDITGGSENYTYTLIGELVRRGYDVQYYCDPGLRGKIAHLIERDFGVEFMSLQKYDLVLANHNTMVEKLYNYGVVIQTCHGVFPLLEQPSEFASAYVVISEEIRLHLEKRGISSYLMLNGIDCDRFYPKVPLSDKPKTILSLCQGDDATDIVRRVCDKLGLRYIAASKNVNNIIDIENYINDADIVVGVGRSLYDAMACGRVCISFDSRSYSTKFDGHSSGGDGYISLENIDQSVIHNCTGRGTGRHIDEEGLVTEISKYRKEDGEELRRYALENLNISISVDKYLMIYNDIRPNIFVRIVHFFMLLRKRSHFNMTEKIKYILNILIVAVMFMTVAVNRDAQMLGRPVEQLVYGAEEQGTTIELVGRGESGETTLNSDAVVEKVFGYGGKTPLKIYLDGERISKVVLAPNTETPEFLNAVVATGLLEKWQGMTLEEAAVAEVDVVSGATMSSSSIIKNVQITAAHSAGVIGAFSHGLSLSMKSILALVVIAFGIFVNLIRPKSKGIRVALLVANVVVLGFWCGSFISLSLITTWVANGVSWSTMLIPFALLVVALVMPLVGRKGSYCANHCPMGAAQELMGMVHSKRVKLPQKFLHRAVKAREVILFSMLLMMWCGVGFSLLDYEIFSAFIFKSASCGILIAASLFLLLSIVVDRPYCRFVCPTGALLTLIQKNR